MSRPLRIQYPNALYYITSLGNTRKEFISFINEKYHSDICGDLKGGAILGSKEFLEKISDYLRGN